MYCFITFASYCILRSKKDYFICKVIEDSSQKKKDFRITWIKSHVGNFGNEMADIKTKEAAIDGKPFHILPMKYYTLLEKTNWNKNWETHKDGRPLYHFLKKVDTNRLYSDFHINMMLTGHGYFLEDFNCFNTRKINCVCENPKQLANSFHLINECDQFADA